MRYMEDSDSAARVLQKAHSVDLPNMSDCSSKQTKEPKIPPSPGGGLKRGLQAPSIGLLSANMTMKKCSGSSKAT